MPGSPNQVQVPYSRICTPLKSGRRVIHEGVDDDAAAAGVVEELPERRPAHHSRLRAMDALVAGPDLVGVVEAVMAGRGAGVDRRPGRDVHDLGGGAKPAPRRLAAQPGEASAGAPCRPSARSVPRRRCRGRSAEHAAVGRRCGPPWPRVRSRMRRHRPRRARPSAAPGPRACRPRPSPRSRYCPRRGSRHECRSGRHPAGCSAATSCRLAGIVARHPGGTLSLRIGRNQRLPADRQATILAVGPEHALLAFDPQVENP